MELVQPRYGFLEGSFRTSPIAFWQVETYSFGKTYRDWLRWPTWLPLPMAGDHGVALMRKYWPEELRNFARTYLTSATWRVPHPDKAKLTLRVPHPWVTYRNRHGLKASTSQKGTLVFVPHTLPGNSRDAFDYGKYLTSLQSLPAKFHPFSLCIQMHDVKKGLAAELSRHGLPIYTVGNSSSPYFVDRFYDLILRFKYATSNVSGSQTFYCEEAGVEYFLFGEEPRTIFSPEGNPESYYRGADLDLVSRVTTTFSIENIGHPERKAKFVKETLGLDVDSVKSVRFLRRRLIIDTLFLWPALIALSLLNLLRSLVAFVFSATKISRQGKQKT